MDAEERYASAKARRDAIEAEWIRLNMPLVGYGSQNQEQEHVLVKMLREHDALLVKLGAELKRVHRGPVPSAVPSIRVPKSSKLRSVG